jgi:hypothetical protein
MKRNLAAVVAAVGLLCWAYQANAQETKSYEKVAKLIRLVSEDGFEPTTATLVAGELMCPSGQAYVTILSCMAELLHTPDFEQAMKAECLHEEKKLDCHKSRSSSLVNVLKVYDMLIPGESPTKHLVVKIDISGADRYVNYGSLDF